MLGVIRISAGALAVVLLSFSGCSGFVLPPVTVSLPLVQDAEIPGASLIAGEASIPLGAFCGLLNEEDLDQMVREAAGDEIADLVTITSVELTSIELMATEGTFQPFTESELTLTILELGGETLTLGAAMDGNGLGMSFSLVGNPPVDLLNDLEEDQCGSPTIHFSGGGILEASDVVFDVSVTVTVYAEIGEP